ncbi:Uncharacterised protein [Vibrio cholerae]|nr:Uncharacterised protein [Vibrio cholerae]CSI62097.1 Uncharacterised protein [Vibrio cholerae]
MWVTKRNHTVTNDHRRHRISTSNGTVNIADCTEHIVGGDIALYGINFMSQYVEQHL